MVLGQKMSNNPTIVVHKYVAEKEKKNVSKYVPAADDVRKYNSRSRMTSRHDRYAHVKHTKTCDRQRLRFEDRWTPDGSESVPKRTRD